MSRPEFHSFDLPPGARDGRHYHHSAHSLSLNPTDRRQPLPPTLFSPFVPRSVISPDNPLQRSAHSHDPYGGTIRGDNRGSPNVPYPLQLGPLSAPIQSPFPTTQSSARPHSVGFPFGNSLAQYSSYTDQDSHLSRPATNNKHLVPSSQPQNVFLDPRNTLWWGELEPWMDEEYAKQVCTIMNWEPINIKVPRPPPNPANSHQANNAGHCLLTFASQAQAMAVVNQIRSSGAIIMPNSSKPFVINWASVVPPSPAPVFVPQPPPTVQILQPQPQTPQQFIKEHSIFVGDLAPEVSNSDLVAVFRNPVLGLRNDREPRFIRPFLSCKSAKIMLDPITGVSRGYGFVRFTDEEDQQRALIEMHGLYCLSRPMRISPATAKYKIAGSSGEILPANASDLPQEDQSNTSAQASTAQAHSVSAPLASGVGPATSSSGPNPPSSSEERKAANSTVPRPNSSNNSITSAFAGQQTQNQDAQKYVISEESWKHHVQARAILSNLIGPNGEQLSSSDPYNTTVFVGGLSPLISEDTLRTFFVPFGEIHYVKVPAGKNCGFVQFIRKPDAERAIEKMQGFPIGGSRIRLSWGRSQYKAAQAAAQAAQTAALQTPSPQQGPSQTPVQPRVASQSQTPQTQTNQSPPEISPEQALELIQKLGLTRYLNNPEPPSHSAGDHFNSLDRSDDSLSSSVDANNSNGTGNSIDAQIMRSHLFNNFSPFAPDSSLYLEGADRSSTVENFGPAFGQGNGNRSERVSSDTPTTNSGGTATNSAVVRPNSASAQQRFGLYDANRSSSRQDGPGPIQRNSPTRKTPPGAE